MIFMNLAVGMAAVILAGCTADPPAPELIIKAKDETQAIMDSLQNEEDLIVEQFELTSEFFDDNSMKYVINYHVRAGMDSAHIAEDDATAFLEKQNRQWKYTFIFDKTYIRDLSIE
jgi:hypothetical protein